MHAVAVAEAVGDLEADLTAGDFDGAFEDDGGGGAVDVVVAVDFHGLGVADGALDAGDGEVHIAEEEGVVEVVEGGGEEAPGGAEEENPRAQRIWATALGMPSAVESAAMRDASVSGSCQRECRVKPNCTTSSREDASRWKGKHWATNEHE